MPGAREAVIGAIALGALAFGWRALRTTGDDVAHVAPTIDEMVTAVLLRSADELDATQYRAAAAQGNNVVTPALDVAAEKVAKEKGWDLDFDPGTGKLKINGVHLGKGRVKVSLSEVNLYKAGAIGALTACLKPLQQMTEHQYNTCLDSAKQDAGGRTARDGF